MAERLPGPVELAGSWLPPVPGARSVGPWSPEEEIELTLLLRRTPPGSTGSGGVGPLGPDLGRRVYLTRAEFDRRFGIASRELEALREFARLHGLTLRPPGSLGRAVRLHGRVSDLGRAFGVEILRFDHPTVPYRGPQGPVRLPAPLAGLVTGVFGLDSRPVLRPHFRRNTDPQASGYSLPEVASAYQFPPPVAGSSPSIGILEFGGGYTASDLTEYFGGLGLEVPNVVTVGVDGAGNAPTGDPNGPDAEVELDLEVVGALAPSARITVYFAPNTEQGFVDALSTAIHDAAHAPTVVSVSWGSPESSWTGQARDALETAAQDGAAMGLTILAAAGDQGASDGEPAGTLAVDFPASSPYVLGCGGTRLELSGTTIVSEVVWNDLSEDEGATGGGVSEDFPLPSYQSNADVPSAPNGFEGRGVPDVAADADPETGYAVFVDGAATVIGGTSAVAPLWGALIARLSESLGKPLGYANPLLYPTGVAASFRAITSGNNDGYSAGPGWNPCTGLGSPQGAALLAALRTSGAGGAAP